MIDLIKNKLLDEDVILKVSNLFKVLSDSTRINILYTLKSGKLSVSQISEVLSMTPSAISHQLKTLRQANLVSFKKMGKEVYYEMADLHVYTIFNQAIEHVKEGF